MSRRLKFRVWDAKLQKMMSWNPFIRFDDLEYVVQQFTGLFDKNGREIYEGDIISGSFYDEEYRHAETLKAEVVFNNGAFNISSTNWHKPSLRVIGNIFEDLALLG